MFFGNNIILLLFGVVNIICALYSRHIVFGDPLFKNVFVPIRDVRPNVFCYACYFTFLSNNYYSNHYLKI